jgi:hypothetical protein
LFSDVGVAHKYLHGISRVLKPKGKLIFITDDPPEQRMEVLQGALEEGFRVTARSLDETEAGSANWTYFMYVCTAK